MAWAPYPGWVGLGACGKGGIGPQNKTHLCKARTPGYAANQNVTLTPGLAGWAGLTGLADLPGWLAWPGLLAWWTGLAWLAGCPRVACLPALAVKSKYY